MGREGQFDFRVFFHAFPLIVDDSGKTKSVNVSAPPPIYNIYGF